MASVLQICIPAGPEERTQYQPDLITLLHYLNFDYRVESDGFEVLVLSAEKATRHSAFAKENCLVQKENFSEN